MRVFNAGNVDHGLDLAAKAFCGDDSNVRIDVINNQVSDSVESFLFERVY